jgi:Ca2+-binding RTX toxin-like protein
MLDGRRGQDLLRGSAGADRLLGGRGRDILEAAGGNDVLVGGWGDDSVVAGPGADLLRDDAGLNYLEGGPGRDRFVARAGRSLMAGGPGDDASRVAHGVFALDGGAGNDTYRLGRRARADVIEGPNAGRDRIVSAVNVRVPFGIERVDAVGGRRLRVTGGRGAQTIVANDVGNAIDAGAGVDRVIGGRAGDAITTDAYGSDTITTGRGADRVIVRGILTSPGTGILLAAGRGVTQPPARVLARATTRVTDLRPRDRIVLDSATLGREVRGLKRQTRLITGRGARARTVAPTLTYDTRARLLSYDADGTGASVSRPLLTLDRAAGPTGATFIIR